MTDREKRGEDRNTKIWTSWQKKSFLGGVNSIIRNYLRAVIWWKKKRKIADTSFKACVRYIFDSLFCMSKIEWF